jgi:hypothetical protein
MSMIRPFKFSLDLSDVMLCYVMLCYVMEAAGVLDTIPFPIIYKQTIRSMPDFSNIDEATIKSAFAERKRKKSV